MKKTTMADVAKHAGVSKSAISQYLNKRYDYMSLETRKRIGLAIKELGYQPNIVARSLKLKSTSTIGVIVANILHTFSTQVIRAIEDICHEADFHLIVCNADDDPNKEKRYIDMLRAKQVDGLIIFPTGDNLSLYQQMVEEEYPVVFIDRVVSDMPIPTIALDNIKASKLAVQHFLNNGYDRIAIITTSIIRNISPRIERIQGYKEALRESGMEVVNEYIKSSERDKIQDSIKEMLSLEKPPQAILAGNDLALMEILKYVKDHQLKIPTDLSVVGIDDVSFANLYSPPLTTVAQPAFEMGKKAAELLLEIIKKEEMDSHKLIYHFEPNLIIRES